MAPSGAGGPLTAPKTGEAAGQSPNLRSVAPGTGQQVVVLPRVPAQVVVFAELRAPSRPPVVFDVLEAPGTQRRPLREGAAGAAPELRQDPLPVHRGEQRPAVHRGVSGGPRARGGDDRWGDVDVGDEVVAHLPTGQVPRP